MMMPANFTAVNSEVVYGGTDLFSILADTTVPIWKKPATASRAARSSVWLWPGLS